MQNLDQRKRIPHWTNIHRFKRDFPEGTSEKIKITSYFVVTHLVGEGYIDLVLRKYRLEWTVFLC